MSKPSSSLDLRLSCSRGMEPLLCDEIHTLTGMSPTSGKGIVHCQGTLEQAYILCLRSRLASRILLVLREGTVATPDQLYELTASQDWSHVFVASQTFAIHVTTAAEGWHSQFAMLRVKDAIVDQMRQVSGTRPTVSTHDPDIRIQAHIADDGHTSLMLDLSGESLHQRGYRRQTTEAPLKENLAASVLVAGGWGAEGAGTADVDVLIDPFCGSGTLLIEAMLIQLGIAPGVWRAHWGFSAWRGHDAGLWQQLQQAARQQAEASVEQFQRQKPHTRYLGYDADPQAVRAAVCNIESAGLQGLIHVERRDVAQLALPQGSDVARSWLVANPPYGERLSDVDSVIWLYRGLGDRLRQQMPGLHYILLGGQVEVLDQLRWGNNKRLRWHNGPLALFVQSGAVPEERSTVASNFVDVHFEAPPEKDDFANRLIKNLREVTVWAKRQQVSCYRIYDADMPEYNVAIDIYGDCVHVAEYAPPKTVDAKKAEQRFHHALSIVRSVLQVPREKVFVKVRKQQKGRNQYEKNERKGRFMPVREGRAQLLVNLSEYLDTGLFLDHRITRQWLAGQVAGKRFLNLYCYTGSVTVQAASGGARSSVSVDMSTTYLDWASCNLSFSGFSPQQHRLERADVMRWLEQAQEQFDVIFVDPPTFSNSKKMHGVFDVQRDHVELLELAMKRLEPGGMLVFSNNFRRFELAPVLSQMFSVTDISAVTLPFDYRRNPRIHQCWILRRKQDADLPLTLPVPDLPAGKRAS